MAKNWVFQVRERMSEAQEAKLSTLLQQMLQEWKSHGEDVPASAEIRNNHFIIIRVHEYQPGGCSIDSMHNSIKQIFSQTGLDLLSPNFIGYRNAEDQIIFADFREYGSLAAGGEVNADSVIYDPSLAQQDNLDYFEVRLGDSWLGKRLFAGVK